MGKDLAARIRKAALDLNYQPNLIARSLQSGRSWTIGLIVADISNPFFSSIARIVEDEAGREALRARFLYSQSFSQDDPWAERAAGANAELHQHLDPIAIAAE